MFRNAAFVACNHNSIANCVHNSLVTFLINSIINSIQKYSKEIIDRLFEIQLSQLTKYKDFLYKKNICHASRKILLHFSSYKSIMKGKKTSDALGLIQLKVL